MEQLQLSTDVYIDEPREHHVASGGAYHRQTFEQGGSISTLIGHYFAERTVRDSFQPYSRLSCFLFPHPLAPEPEVLARAIAEALKSASILSEPFFVSWYTAEECGGAAYGELFDVD